IPGPGVRVQVRAGHSVRYDLDSDKVIRSIHVAGTLEFARDRNTRLDVGLIKVQPGDDASENGFDCDAHPASGEAGHLRPSLIVGRPDEPILAGKTAKIRLTYVEGMNKETCPAIIACGGRMEFHGTPLVKTWTKLSREAHRNEPIILVKADQVADWKPGDRIILAGTTRQFGYKDTRTYSVVERPSTEERVIVEIKKYVESGLVRMTLDKPLDFDHRAEDDYRAEVANLSRNVIIESSDPDGVRGHTMYHRNSAGSVSYAEFRHLGKAGVLGKYSLHFHLAGDSMRGTSVVGASFWDSKNRWITIHGTNYLVVRDCVGYKSVGHGFFLEDGTETRNVFDGNLAVMALRGKPLPDQVLPYDKNLGSGFWWANSLNSFTNNSAAECDQDGYRFEVFAGAGFNPTLSVLQADGSKKRTDIRTLPFIRFENNEAHCMRFFGLNLGGFNDGGVPAYAGEKPAAKEPTAAYPRVTTRERIEDVEGVGPDPKHPFLIKNYRAWDTHWAFHAGSPSVRADGLDLYDSQYGVWRSVVDHHEYGDLKMAKIISRGVFFPRPGLSKPDDMAFLTPTDDLPPSTAITTVVLAKTNGSPTGRLLVRGSCADDYTVKRVTVNDIEARPLRPNFAQWEVEIDAPNGAITALAEDDAGNLEKMPHVLTFGMSEEGGLVSLTSATLPSGHTPAADERGHDAAQSSDHAHSRR
ncbi:G8 domain-containing protein, partial [Singulisphaera rosea]